MYEELALVTVEAEKSHDLPPASWRPGEASDVIQSESKGLRIRGANDVNPSPRAWEVEMGCPHSAVRQEKKGGFLILYHSSWIRPSAA